MKIYKIESEHGRRKRTFWVAQRHPDRIFLRADEAAIGQTTTLCAIADGFAVLFEGAKKEGGGIYVDLQWLADEFPKQEWAKARKKLATQIEEADARVH